MIANRAACSLRCADARQEQTTHRARNWESRSGRRRGRENGRRNASAHRWSSSWSGTFINVIDADFQNQSLNAGDTPRDWSNSIAGMESKRAYVALATKAHPQPHGAQVESLSRSDTWGAVNIEEPGAAGQAAARLEPVRSLPRLYEGDGARVCARRGAARCRGSVAMNESSDTCAR